MAEDIFLTGKFDGRYSAFIETVAGHRAKLHRYCSRHERDRCSTARTSCRTCYSELIESWINYRTTRV